jgi:hypothetical protein
MAVNRDTSSFFRLVFFLVALIIIAASTWFSNDLGKELAAEEQKKIELWAEAIRLLAQEPQPGEEDVRFDYTLTLKVIEGNTNIPVILTDGDNNVQSYANLNLSKKHPEADLENKAAHLIQSSPIGSAHQAGQHQENSEEKFRFKNNSLFPLRPLLRNHRKTLWAKSHCRV